MLIIAHRGASATAPENTLQAFTLAFALQSDGIEFDTYQHDEAIVVFHDKTLGRTTNGSGLLLQTPLAQLKQLDAGDGETIPTLEDVLATLPVGALCNIEVKHLHNAESWVRDVKRAVEEANIEPDTLLISSFNHHWLAAISGLWPEVATGALTATYALDATHCARQLKAKSINIALDIVNQDFVNEAKLAGLDVYVYTVDEPEDMLQLKQWGVTGIFTNVPDIAKGVLA
ncbi:glycerophosphodiester phosphodiesterase family protein [Alteromonas sp. 1_MG-2023]|uniref:glycerophosphodiester phosphodiesterase n=1 Tax=Alteromonas sp. 1_MG-2023 TaxID=3062669 RepID=UPI0026E2E2E4|nr:glycerophosphodiester phosphodiesterase family protein [Alteromonas sp. 1_MG-2023]MDO6567874.1 glycerophosphodiester phosphodiesterase family protein [Alteromonas sp. 1_MG-2023]